MMGVEKYQSKLHLKSKTEVPVVPQKRANIFQKNGNKTFMSGSSCLIHSKFGKLGNIKSVEKYKVNNFKIQYNMEK